MRLFLKKKLRWYVTVPPIAIGAFIGISSEAYIGLLTAPECGITDRLQEWTSGINHYFLTHSSAAHSVLITTSLWFDLSVLFLMGRTLFGHSIRPFLGLFLFMFLRQSCQFLVSLPIPPGIIWQDPGFPSLFVPYNISNDFYFSAHTGISLLCALELSRLGKTWLTALGFILFSYMLIAVICFRAHYTMDVFTAVLVVFLVTHFSNKWSPRIDRFLHRYS